MPKQEPEEAKVEETQSGGITAQEMIDELLAMGTEKDQQIAADRIVIKRLQATVEGLQTELVAKKVGRGETSSEVAG